MAAYEEKSLQYYSSSLEKLDDLIALSELQLDQREEQHDEYLKKLESIEKDLAKPKLNGIDEVTSLLKSVITKQGIKIDLSSLELPEYSAEKNSSEPSTKGLEFIIKNEFPDLQVLIDSSNKTNELLQNVISNGISLADGEYKFTAVNNTVASSEEKPKTFDFLKNLGKPKETTKIINTTINDGNNLIITDISDTSKITEIAKSFPKVAKNFQKGIDRFASIDSSGITKINSILTEIKDINDKIEEEDVNNLRTLSKTILGFGINLLLVGPIYALASFTVVPAIAASLGLLGLAFRAFPDEKQTKEVSKALMWTGIGITALALSFVVWDRADFDVMNIVSAISTMAAVGAAFGLLGKFDKTIKSGAKAVGYMSLAIIGFSLSLAASDALIGNDAVGTLINVGLLGVSLGAMGLVFGILGKFAKNIAVGALAVGVMSISIGVFGAAIGYALDQIGGDSIESTLTNLGMLGLSLAGMGLVFGLLGSFIAPIGLGALAVAAMGISLIPFGYALGQISALDIDLNQMLQFGVVLGGLGVVYSAAGAISPLILAGSAAFGAVGLSLIALEEGISRFVGLQSEDLSFFTSFEDGESGFTNLMLSLSEGASRAAGFSEIAGAASMAAIGLSLQALSSGIEPFVGTNNLFVRAINEDLGGTIGTFLDQLTAPFIALSKGQTDPSGSLAGLVFGADFGLTDAMQGARSVASMGDALQSISMGIKPFVGAENEITKALLPENNLGNNIARFISELTEPFIALGEGNSSSSLTGLIFGNDMSITDAEAGANSVLAMGNALQSISTGIKPFTGQDNEIIKAINNDVGGTIGKFIAAITHPFIDIVDGEGGKSSLLSSLIGTDFSMSKAQEGASSVMDITEALIGVSKSADTFYTVANKIDLDKYQEQVNVLATALPNAWTQIQLPEEVTKGKEKLKFFEASHEMIMEAIDSSSKLGKVSDEYDSIAQSFVSMATSSNKIKDNINSMEVEQLKEFSSLLYNAKEFIIEAEDSSIESAVSALGNQLSNVASTIGSFFSDEDETSGTDSNTTTNKAMSKKDIIMMVKALTDKMDQNTQQTNATLSQIKIALNSTLTVRDADA